MSTDDGIESNVLLFKPSSHPQRCSKVKTVVKQKYIPFHANECMTQNKEQVNKFTNASHSLSHNPSTTDSRRVVRDLDPVCIRATSWL